MEKNEKTSDGMGGRQGGRPEGESAKTGTKGTIGTYPFSPHTHMRARSDAGLPDLPMSGEPWGLTFDSDLESVPDGDVQLCGSEPMTPLPCFDQTKGMWPREMQEVVDVGRSKSQRDILLLGYLVVTGAILGSKVRTMYNGKWLSPTLMFFAVAPPACGKGVLAWLRQIIQPFHDRLRSDFERQQAAYRQEKMRFDTLGKARASDPEMCVPEAPVRKFFIIPGNNSGTGMVANLINSGGRGIIFETEADTVSAALSADYGHFDDTLRNTFDHERVSFYRRGDDESRECETTFLSMLLCGTPGQVKPLLGSGIENGLTSRIVWYYMPAVREWQNQFDCVEDLSEKFKAIGQKWVKRMESLVGVSHFTFELTEVQQEVFNAIMSGIFDRGRHAAGDESVSSVIRIAHHLLRIMSVVALLRCFEHHPAPAGKGVATGGLMQPAPDISQENVRDGIVARYVYGIGDEDFMACMMMANVLFCHSVHILSLLPETEITNRGSADKDKLFSQMKDTFTRKDYLEKAGEMQVNENTALQWLKRAMKKKQLLKVGHGLYQFARTCV